MILLGLAAISVSARGFAQYDDAQEQRAEMLFREGKRLHKEKKYAEAARAFEESDKIEPAPGTEFFLADCYEKIGQVTKAWLLFKAVAEKTNKPNQKAETLARAVALEPQLPRLTIVVPSDVAALKGLTITRDDGLVPSQDWNVAVPVDPDTLVIQARAPKRRAWRTVVTVVRGSTLEVHVPPLVEIAPPALEVAPLSMQPSTPDNTTSARSVGRTTAVVLVGLGVLGVAAGSGFGIQAITKKRELESVCPNYPHCPTALDPSAQRSLLSNDSSAVTMADLSTGAFVVGGVAVAASAIIWGLSPGHPRREVSSAREDKRKSDYSLRILPNPSSGGAVILGTF